MSKKTLQNIMIVKLALGVAAVVLLVAFTSNLMIGKAFAQGIQTLPGGTGPILVPTGSQQPISPSSATSVACPTPTTSSATGDLHGWLWSDMPNGSDQSIVPTDQQAGRGFGWVSLNGSDSGVAGSYKVTLSSSGALSGDAWSENGGWLDFAPSGPYPTIAGESLPTTSASVNAACLTAGQASCPVTGWARFVAGEDSNTQDTGGWDGWVNLSGYTYGSGTIGNVPLSNGTFGVTFDANSADANFGKFSGYAWGGMDTGWIGFSGASVSPTSTCVNPTICNDPAATNYHQTGACIYPTATPVSPVSPSGPVSPSSPTNPDECPNLPGTQTGNGPWQAPNGRWYGLSAGTCSPSVCTNLTNTYYATAPANYTVTTDSSGNSICIMSTGTSTGTGTGVPLNPVYKEN